MELKSKFLSFKKNFYTKKYLKKKALSRIYLDYIDYLKSHTKETIDNKVAKYQEKAFRVYQEKYYDLGNEEYIFNTVYNHKYQELKKKYRMQFRVYREATRRKIAKLDPITQEELIKELAASIANKEKELAQIVEDIAASWRAEYEAQRANGIKNNPDEETLALLKKDVENSIAQYRELISAKYNAKLELNTKKCFAKSEKYSAQTSKTKVKLDEIVKVYSEYIGGLDAKKEGENLVTMRKEVEHYEDILAKGYLEVKKGLKTEQKPLSEKDVEKYTRILNTLKAELESKVNNENKPAIEDDEILSVNDLCMYFGGIKAVNHLNFTVKHKEIFGLIGPNGAGKTTVFNCITQFYKPTAGKLLFRNKNNEIIDLNREVVHNVILQGIVRTFQNLEVIKDITVLDNLLVAAHRSYTSNMFQHMVHSKILRVEENVIKERAKKVLEFMGLLKYKDMYAWGLPYGILKKIEIARTLMCSPQLIILDEPAAGLNDSETVELAELIHRIRDEYDATILLVEHDMGLVMDVCDRICAISFGNLLALGTPSEIQGNKAVQEAYLGVSED